MPTEAVTGTGQVSTTGRKRRSPEPEFVGQPLADHNGNGTVQATAPDGSITNIDASQPGWQDQVRAIDPKHPALKYAD